jgi:hypothetical protein
MRALSSKSGGKAMDDDGCSVVTLVAHFKDVAGELGYDLAEPY